MRDDSKISRLLGIRIPIIQAPMAGASSVELVAAVSNAGGLGSFGAAATSPEKLRETIRAIKKLTNQPFGVNLFAPDVERCDVNESQLNEAEKLISQWHSELNAGPVPEPIDILGPFYQQFEVVLQERVPVFSFHFGPAPIDAISKAHQHDIPVLASATNIEEAFHLEQAGVDAIIAQGYEAGGHSAVFEKSSDLISYKEAMQSTSKLVSTIVEKVSVPVVASGGIMIGAEIHEMFNLGASAAQMGTAFLACPENTIPEAYRESVLGALNDNTVITDVFSGRPARAIKNRYFEEMSQHRDKILPFPAQLSLGRVLRQISADQSNPEFLSMWAGAAVGKVREMPAGKLIEKLWLEFNDEYEKPK